MIFSRSFQGGPKKKGKGRSAAPLSFWPREVFFQEKKDEAWSAARYKMVCLAWVFGPLGELGETALFYELSLSPLIFAATVRMLLCWG